MSGMNPGFAAYLAAKKTSKATPQAVGALPIQKNTAGVVPPMFNNTVTNTAKMIPRGKRHAKISVKPKKGK